MAIRLFRCAECGHRMRLHGGFCGLCYGRKDWWQRAGPVYLGALAAGAVLLVALSVLFGG